MFQGTTVVGDDTHVSRRVCCCCSRNTCGVCVHCGFAVVVVCLDLERRSLMLLHSRVVEYQSETKLVFLGCLFHSLSTIRFIYFIMFFQVSLLRRIFPVCLWRVARRTIGHHILTVPSVQRFVQSIPAVRGNICSVERKYRITESRTAERPPLGTRSKYYGNGACVHFQWRCASRSSLRAHTTKVTVTDGIPCHCHHLLVIVMSSSRFRSESEVEGWRMGCWVVVRRNRVTRLVEQRSTCFLCTNFLFPFSLS